MPFSSSINYKLIENIIKALKKFGFYVFRRELLGDVRNIVNNLSNEKLRQLIKVRPLDKSRRYYIIESDFRAFIAKCKDACTHNGVLDDSCFIKCKEDNRMRIIEDLIKDLNSMLVEG